MTHKRVEGEPVDGLTSVAISVKNAASGYHLLSGQRLDRFGSDYFKPTPRPHPLLGEAALVKDDNTTELPLEAADFDARVTWEVELASVTPETQQAAESILELLFEPDHARELVRVGLLPMEPWSSPTVLDLGPILGRNNVRAFDLRLATLIENDGFSLHDLHVVVSTDWLVRLWGHTRDCDEKEVVSPYSLPGSRVRLNARTAVSGNDGEARLARLVQDILRHHEWGNTVLTARVENWERRFFEAFATDSLEDRDESIVTLQRELSQLRGFLSALHLANKTMRRRAGNQPAFPKLVREEAFERCDELQTALTTQRADLRESFGLLAGAAADRQARAAQATERRINRLTILATLATGIVLVPGLIAAFYGAQIEGLPGQGRVHGRDVLLISSGIAALLTITIFLAVLSVRTHHRRSPGNSA